MGKRLNAEKKLNNETFKAKIGTINRLNPVSIYVSGKTYISPIELQENYDYETEMLRKDLDSILKKYTKNNNLLEKQHISNLEIPKTGIKYGKKTYICFQLYFSQNKLSKLEEIKNAMLPGINDVLDEFKGKIVECGFSIHEKRR